MISGIFSEYTLKLKNVLMSFGFTDLLDICLVAFIIYQAIKLLRDTRAFQLLKGLILVGLSFVLIKMLNMQASEYIFKTLFSNLILVLIIIFHPEIRHALEVAGANGFRNFAKRFFAKRRENTDSQNVKEVVDEFVKAVVNMSENKVGSLTVFERQTLLGEIIKTGTVIDAAATEQMFCNVFFPNSPLHDGAAIVREGRVHAAGCILPLTNNNNKVNKELGTRHRAAIGMSEQSDALLVITSEETGVISIAEKGNLTRNLTPEELTDKLMNALTFTKKDSKGTVKSFIEFTKNRMGGMFDEK
ncbi:MAG: TIGR00159 family protein [Ruminococcaceae bacterium]|nr:TIGR00159 family protein [Oscillospiraceae bacterium]